MAKRKGQILDFTVAAAAAGSTAFALLAMPTELFTEIVWRTRIDVLVPAATPPLGETARIGASAGAALVLFGLVLLLMRTLDRPQKRLSPAERRATPPRIRRADAHPDAPARPPLFAGSDLGEPLDQIPLDEPYDLGDMNELRDDDSPLPSFLMDEPVAEAPWDDQPDAALPEPKPRRTRNGSISSLAAQLPAGRQQDGSISQLMARFEAGVASLGAQEPAAQSSPAPEAEWPKPVEPETVAEEFPDLPAQPVELEAEAPPEAIEEEQPRAAPHHIPSLAEPRPASEMPVKAQALDHGVTPQPAQDDNVETRLRSAIKDLRRSARGG